MDNRSQKETIIWIDNEHINIEQSICNYLIKQLGGRAVLELVITGIEKSPVKLLASGSSTMIDKEDSDKKYSIVEGLKEVLKRKDLQQLG